MLKAPKALTPSTQTHHPNGNSEIRRIIAVRSAEVFHGRSQHSRRYTTSTMGAQNPILIHYEGPGPYIIP